MRISDWSSDVCSSDLQPEGKRRHQPQEQQVAEAVVAEFHFQAGEAGSGPGAQPVTECRAGREEGDGSSRGGAERRPQGAEPGPEKDAANPGDERRPRPENGRASCRERGWT